MGLRGKKAVEQIARLKLLLSGSAGIGKTTAAIQMPKPYIIDNEAGTKHYGQTIEKAGGMIFEPADIDDLITEVRSLMTEKHDFLTLVIDPITTIYDQAVDEAERKVGNEFGRHIALASKNFKRLCGLLTAIDMNVIITAHSKKEYTTTELPDGKKEMTCTGETFDGYKKLDYIFDLWLKLERDKKDGKRYATVAKTRLNEFPDQDRFEWGYKTICNMFGKEKLENGVKLIVLPTDEQVEKLTWLVSQLSDKEIKTLKIDKTLKQFEDLHDMPADRVEKGISLIEDYRKKVGA